MRPTFASTLVSVACVCLAFAGACAEPVEEPAPLRKQGARAAAQPLFLLPPTPQSEGRVFVPFDGYREDERFDYACVRVHGEQWLLETERQDGAPGLLAELGTRRGTSIFSVAAEPASDMSGQRVERSAKALAYIRRGAWAEPEGSPAVSARFGSTLEIVPLVDPHTLQAGDELPLRVRFRGPGLEGATLVAVHADGDTRREWFRGETESAGQLDVKLVRSGLWLLSVQHREEASERSPRTVHVATLSFRIGERG